MVKSMIFYIIFTIATYYDLNIDQINMNIAFFHNLINQLIYVEISKIIEMKANKNMI